MIARKIGQILALMAVMSGLGACSDLENMYLPVQTVPLKSLPASYAVTSCQDPADVPFYYWEALKDCTAKETLVIFAFSGGGIRSAAFGYGALQAAHGVQLTDASGRTHTLDSDIDAVSGVSGGSFTAAAFASHGADLFADGKPDYYRDNFLTHDFFADLASLYLSPLHWRWLFPYYGTNDEMAKIYADIPFSSDKDKLFAADFGVLAKRGRPFLVVQATDYGNEQPFTFTQVDFDLICADVRAYPVGAAIAASSAFPVLFSPIQLTNHHFTPKSDKADGFCHTHRPAWVDTILSQPAPADLSRLYARARAAAQYLPDQKDVGDGPRYVHLQDGGASDNVALRGMTNILIENVPDLDGLGTKNDDTLCAIGLGKLRKILIVAVDGEAQPNRKIATLPYLSDLGLILDVTSSTLIDANGFETMLATDAMVRKLANRLSGLRCVGHQAAQPSDPANETEGKKTVESYFARVSFQDLAQGTVLSDPAACDNPDEGCKVDDLAHSETSLNFSQVQVDALVAAGRAAFLCNPKIVQFLKDNAATYQGATLSCSAAAGETAKSAPTRHFRP